MLGCVGGEFHKDSPLATPRPANVADSPNGLRQCLGRRASARSCNVHLVACEVSWPAVHCDVWLTMQDQGVGPNALTEMLQAIALCVDLLLEPVLECSLPSDAVAGIFPKLVVHRALELCQVRAGCCEYSLRLQELKTCCCQLSLGLQQVRSELLRIRLVLLQ